MQPVNGFHRSVDGGVEAETEVGPAQVVVDGLGNADDVDALLEQLLPNTIRIVAADGDQRVELVVLQRFHAARQSAFALGRVGSRGAQDGAAARQDAGDGLVIQRHRLVLQDAPPAFHKADKLVVVVQNTLAHDRPDHRIEPRTIAAASQNADSHRQSHPSVE